MEGEPKAYKALRGVYQQPNREKANTHCKMLLPCGNFLKEHKVTSVGS